MRTVNLKYVAMAMGVTLGLAGCMSTESAVEVSARTAARSVVNSVVAQRFPGVDAAPFTDCIIDNATTQEIFELAKGAVAVAPSNDAVSTVVTIAGRPAATKCIAQNAIGPLGALLGG